MVRYNRQSGKIKLLEFDLATITAGDYSVEFKIKRENYLTWYEMVYRAGEHSDKSKDIPPAMSLKNFMIKEIETYLLSKTE
jgi:hypothetical protein